MTNIKVAKHIYHRKYFINKIVKALFLLQQARNF